MAPRKTTRKPKTAVVTSTGVPVAAPAAPAKTPTKAATRAPMGLTQVVAQIDVGWGNRLFIRGQGAGLTWQKSEPMQWQNGTWVWQTPSAENFEFKLMLNDRIWQQGFNLQAKAGQKIVFRPQF